MSMDRLTVWYLSHSGFAVLCGRRLFVFDYYKDTPRGGFAKGVIAPEDIKEYDVTVFVSHSHYDHMNPVIFDWADTVPSITYVLDDSVRVHREVRQKPGIRILLVSPHRMYEIGGLTISTLLSTDEGVAYLVKADGAVIFHAGDLNWWHWDDEPERNNLWMEDTYRREVGSLKGERIDLAMLPLDPRQDHNYLLGMDYFMKTVGARYVLPMHFWGNYGVIKKLSRDPDAAPYLDRILKISKRGEMFVLPVDEKRG